MGTGEGTAGGAGRGAGRGSSGRHGEKVRRESGEDDKGESRERLRERGAGGGTEERV